MTKTKTPEVTIAEATFSECGRYRYALRRTWDAGPSHSGTVCWVMLNPSTADADKLDPTLRRCRGFTLGWGFAAMSVVNLYALRSTDPRGLWDTSDPVGPDNDEAIDGETILADLVVVAWGANAKPEREVCVWFDTLARLGDRVVHLGLTKGGQPRHPLYLPADSGPRVYTGPDRIEVVR